MYKGLIFSATLAVVLIASYSSTAASTPRNEHLDVPVCYMQTQNGSTIDMTNLCGSLPESHKVAERTPSPEEMLQRIAEHHREIEKQMNRRLNGGNLSP